jgi:hypothetical protein
MLVPQNIFSSRKDHFGLNDFFFIYVMTLSEKLLLSKALFDLYGPKICALYALYLIFIY